VDFSIVFWPGMDPAPYDDGPRFQWGFSRTASPDQVPNGRVVMEVDWCWLFFRKQKNTSYIFTYDIYIYIVILIYYIWMCIYIMLLYIYMDIASVLCLIDNQARHEHLYIIIYIYMYNPLSNCHAQLVNFRSWSKCSEGTRDWVTGHCSLPWHGMVDIGWPYPRNHTLW